MKQVNLSTLLIPLLAAVAIYVPLSSTSTANIDQSPAAIVGKTSGAAPPAAARTAQVVPNEAARLICDFFGWRPISASNPAVSGDRSGAAKSSLEQYCRVRKLDYTVDFLIATVPDPKDSQLDYLFDRSINSIQRAAETAGYTFDRYSFPWDRGSGSPASPPAEQRSQREPGIILFRNFEQKSGDPTNYQAKLLLVFLVGETPTYGIHKAALINALNQISSLRSLSTISEPAKISACSFNQSADALSIRIMGPSFSGSAASLALTLRSWMRESATPLSSKVCIISGSATAIKVDQFLNLTDFPGDVTFSATVIPDQVAEESFRNYLTSQPLPLMSRLLSQKRPIRIALLTEASTGYGQVIRDAVKSREVADQNEISVLSLTFPVHISRLRAEMAKIRKKDGSLSASPLNREDRLDLPMAESADSKSREIIPLYSSLENVSSELVMSSIITAINREQISYVQVATTDVQDLIFLVREIRDKCPNALIFTLTSDLLYLHSEANLVLQGTLVVTPYPLFTLNQLWSYPYEGLRNIKQFTFPAAQGWYNAVLALLGREGAMLEYSSPFPYAEQNKVRNHHPPLWLSIVGRKGFWPVKLLEIEGDDSAAPQRAISSPGNYTLTIPANEMDGRVMQLGLTNTYNSTSGMGLLLIFSFICLIPPIILLAQLMRFRTLRQQSGAAAPVRAMLKVDDRFGLFRRLSYGWIGQVFGDEEFYRYRLDRRIFQMACCLSLLVVSFAIASVGLLPLHFKDNESHFWTDMLTYLSLFLTLIAVIWLAVSIIDWMIRSEEYFQGLAWTVASIFMGAVLIVLVVGALANAHFNQSYAEKVFLFLRATELTSGVSLLLPIILIGLAAFIYFFSALRRLNLAESMPCLREPQQSPDEVPAFLRFDHEKAKSFVGLKKIETRVKELIVCNALGIPGGLLSALLILIVYGRFFWRPYLPSVEGVWFDRLFIFLFYLVPVLLIGAFLRFFWIWTALRKLLRRLSWHPLFTKFAIENGDHPDFQNLPKIDLTTPVPTYTALSISVRQARHLLNRLKLEPEQAETSARIEPLVEIAETGLGLALDNDARLDWRQAFQHRLQAQAAICDLGEPVTELLEESWMEATPNDAPGWRNEAGLFLITLIVTFLQYVFAHLQNLVALVTGGLILMLIAANVYPFQPHEPLLLFSWVSMLSVVVVTMLSFVQMSRDRVLSQLTGTTPGQLNLTRDFVVRVLIHGLVPVLALLGAQFPEILRSALSWLNLMQGSGN